MKTAVLVGTMGGPKTLGEVAQFLFRLFNDKAILGVPQPFRCLLASIITLARLKQAKANYAQIGGGSPILENTKAQAEALEETLNKRVTGTYKVFVGMSYSAPFIRDAVAEIKDFAPDQLILLPLYPQRSTTTTNSFLTDCDKAISQNNVIAPVRRVERFCENEGFLSALEEKTRACLREGGADKPFVIFTAHGLPEKIVERGDTYPKACEKTARALAVRLGLEASSWCLAYQSRVGPVKWIGPCLEEVVLEQSRAKRGLVIVPISFVCEHVETLGELGIDLRQLALAEGCPDYRLVPTVSCAPVFIEGLASII